MADNTYNYEYTDTFGGERNYCWVKRGTVSARDLNHAVRLAKSAVGLTGVRCARSASYMGAELVPSGYCTVLSVEESS